MNHGDGGGGQLMSFRQQESAFLGENAKIKKTSETKTKLQFRQMLLCFVAEHFFIKIVANVWLDGGCSEAELKSIRVINEATVIEV